MKHLYIILLVLPLIGFGQGWEQIFGGDEDDIGYSVQQNSDGGYIICGVTESFGNGQDVYLIKIDENGEEMWSQTFGGTEDDQGLSIQQTSDGGYIITGSTYSFGNGLYDYDVFLIKTDGSGIEEWSQTFGGSLNDFSYSVQETSDGGYIITGMTGSFGNGSYDVYLIKTDVSGNEIWSQTFGGTGWDSGSSVQQTTDGGYIITGNTRSFGNGSRDVYLIKTDENGNEQWSQMFGGTNSDRGYSIQQTTDGGYIICGVSETSQINPTPDYDNVYLIKTGNDGNEEWSQTYDGSGGDDWGYSVQQTTDGGYIVCGVSETLDGTDYVYLIKTNGQGNVTSTIELPTPTGKRELIKTTNILGQENTTIKNQPLIEIYDDGSTEKKIVIE